jgi:hypothetical protein
MIHDIDLKEDRFSRPGTAGIKLLIDGIVNAHAEDADRMQRGGAVFDDLYASFNGKSPRPSKSSKTSRSRKPR